MIVTVTGASGFIGSKLIARLQKDGHTVRALGRNNPKLEGVEFTKWDPLVGAPPEGVLSGSEAIIHLAGEPVAQRWTDDIKRRIRDSRIKGTRNLVYGIAAANPKPLILLSSSAIGYYGDRADQALAESAGPGKDFLASVCVEWEKEARAAGQLDVRVALFRSGIVLGPGGGALQQMLGPFRKGVGGPVGSGKQWVSWIHIDDLTALYSFALSHEQLFGPVNAVAPQAVRQGDFAKALGSALGRPAVVPTPALALKMMFGEMSQIILGSQRVKPDAAQRVGFEFRHTDLQKALADVLKNGQQ